MHKNITDLVTLAKSTAQVERYATPQDRLVKVILSKIIHFIFRPMIGSLSENGVQRLAVGKSVIPKMSISIF